MRKYAIQAIVILLLLETAFIAMAVWNPKIRLWGNNEHPIDFHFCSLGDLFANDTITGSVASVKVDSITEHLIKSDTLVIYALSKTALLDSAFLPNTSEVSLDTNFNSILNPSKEGVLALDNFFKSLIEERDSKLIRIAHYGDSQLEGDRITCEIRRNLQAKFGGAGIGYLPFDDVTSCASYTRETNGSLTRYNVFNNRFKKGADYGLSGNTFQFGIADSANTDSIKASVSFTLNHGVSYQRMTLLYGRSPKGFTVKVFRQSDNELLCVKDIEATNASGITTLELASISSSFRLEFTSIGMVDLFGLQLDSDHGVTVDNYAIRGHSGDGLMLINQQYLSKCLSSSNTHLVIFEYGNNMVPYIKSDEQCAKTQELFYRLFMKYKEAAPEASILVIGNGDMAYKSGGVAQSYKYVRGLNDALKAAAIQANCGFWNLLDNMGGENSILIWNEKGLATLEGHLTPKGQKIMANLIFKAIMVEYNNFVIRNFYAKK